ncbi:MAG: hypothetical protein JXA25_15515 [Anaerolineales bacterium]|nr:hypothetical protein [Anaerolineales bacterium]
MRKTALILCLIIAALSPAAGFALAGIYTGVVPSLLAGLLWLPARKYPHSWMPSISLTVSTALAAAGVLNGLSFILMIIGAGAALAGWDLLLLNAELENTQPGEKTRQYESRHMQTLALAVIFGILAALPRYAGNLQIPFFVMIILIAIMLFALDRIWGFLNKGGKL